MNNLLKKIYTIFPKFYKSILLSYSQIFFSNSLVFAVILFVVTFFDIWCGIAGLISVVFSNSGAYLIGFNKNNIQNGYYGFNSLLVGLGLGAYFAPSIEFYFILLCASFLTLILTVVFEGVIGKYGLPFLSMSFLLVLWIVSIATRNYHNIEISERGIYVYNELYSQGGNKLINLYNWVSNLPLSHGIQTYFKSLGAIFFQYNNLAGILISLGLLYYSRIAFTLSLIGFFTAYLFYNFIGADLNQLNNSYVGFNFILTSIALGGFFIIPSRQSYLWIVALVPIISILISALTVILSVYQLAIYSLPFNIMVISFLYILKFRERNFSLLQLVIHQNFSPEKNLYHQLNYSQRFDNLKYIAFNLPFIDEWKITQGHNGKITHRGEWQHALDFEIDDENQKYYHSNGFVIENYFCYNKPVIAPADGYIVKIVDNIQDNEIGEVNIEHNWGNSIIIKHTELLYSNLSHLKKDSFKVKEGDYVLKGDILAYVGNSGRSPQPHLHFQIQNFPYIGSQTINYPIAHYIEKKNDKYKIHFFDIPKQNQNISNIKTTSSLENAFNFIPGKKLYFEFINLNTNDNKKIEWEIFVDYYNTTYIYCKDSNSYAYFRNDGKIFSFNSYVGSKKNELFFFYLAFYRISLGYYKNLIIEDKLPLTLINNKILLFLQDFVAPFKVFLNSNFILKFIRKSEDFSKSDIEIESKATFGINKKIFKQIKFNILLHNENFESIKFRYKNSNYEIKQVEYHRIIK